MAKKTAAHNPARLKKLFLADLAKTGNITQSAESVGISRRLHYTWLEEDDDEGTYRAAYDRAIQAAADVLEAEAWRRGVDGVEEPVGWYRGEPGGKIRRYSDTLLIFLLKGIRPEKFRERFDHNVRTPDGPLDIRVSYEIVDPSESESTP